MELQAISSFYCLSPHVLASIKEKAKMVWKRLCILPPLSGSDFSYKEVSRDPGKILFSAIIQIALAKYTFNNSILRVVLVPPSPPPFLGTILSSRGLCSEALSKVGFKVAPFPPAHLLVAT